MTEVVKLCPDGPWSRIESPTVSVFSHILFKVTARKSQKSQRPFAPLTWTL